MWYSRGSWWCKIMTWSVIIDITWPSRQCRRCWQSPSGSLLPIPRSNLIQNFFCVFICAHTVSSGRWWRVMWRQERSFNFIFLSFWCNHCCRWSPTSVFTRHFVICFGVVNLTLGCCNSHFKIRYLNEWINFITT